MIICYIAMLKAALCATAWAIRGGSQNGGWCTVHAAAGRRIIFCENSAKKLHAPTAVVNGTKVARANII